MTKKEFDNLERGDIVRPVNNSNSYVVHNKYKSGNGWSVVVCRILTATSPDEWDLAVKNRETE